MTNAELIAALRVEPFEVGSFGLARIINQAANTIEAQQKALDECAKQLAYMAARLPKKGEWNIRETASGDVEAKCTKCGFEMLVNQPGNGLLMVSELLYCPHCGSRMAKGEQDG